MPRLYVRWVWSEIETLPGQKPRPVIYEYLPENRCHTPHYLDDHTHTLSHCEFLFNEFEAAEKDPRITVLPSLHSHETIAPHVADGLAKQGHAVRPTMRLHDALTAAAKTNGERQYLPDE